MVTKETLFRRNVKHSFKRSKEDIEAFKSLMTSWILKFQRENEDLKEEISVLKRRLNYLENELLVSKRH
jgi:cell division septum initiation protein DivIVA